MGSAAGAQRGDGGAAHEQPTAGDLHPATMAHGGECPRPTR
jgi:hypothetical protein